MHSQLALNLTTCNTFGAHFLCCITLADKGVGKVCLMPVIGSRVLELKLDEYVSDGDFSYNTKEIKCICLLTHFKHL
jgi:hypothetical protein